MGAERRDPFAIRQRPARHRYRFIPSSPAHRAHGRSVERSGVKRRPRSHIHLCALRHGGHRFRIAGAAPANQGNPAHGFILPHRVYCLTPPGYADLSPQAARWSPALLPLTATGPCAAPIYPKVRLHGAGVAIDLPASRVPERSGPAFNEPGHVVRRIAGTQAVLVRERNASPAFSRLPGPRRQTVGLRSAGPASCSSRAASSPARSYPAPPGGTGAAARAPARTAATRKTRPLHPC